MRSGMKSSHGTRPIGVKAAEPADYAEVESTRRRVRVVAPLFYLRVYSMAIGSRGYANLKRFLSRLVCV